MEDIPMKIFTVISDTDCVVEEGVLRGQYFLLQEKYNHAYFNNEGGVIDKNDEQAKLK